MNMNRYNVEPIFSIDNRKQMGVMSRNIDRFHSLTTRKTGYSNILLVGVIKICN